MKRLVVIGALCLLAIAAGSGCQGKKTANPDSQGASAAASTNPGSQPESADNSPDPCSLLEVSEVETVTGPLAGPPYRTGDGYEVPTPLADGDACAYQTPDFRTILISATWDHGPTAYAAVSMRGNPAHSAIASTNAPEAKAARTLLPGGVQMDGEWDEASSFGCCVIYALRGDRMVTFDYRGWRADTEHAVSLLNRALLRLDHPLAMNGNAGNDAAAKRAAAFRPTPRDVCGVLSRAEVESVLGRLLAEPHPGPGDKTESCVYRFQQGESKESPVADASPQFKSFVRAVTGGRTGMVAGPVDTVLTVRWKGGFRQLSDNALVAGATMGSFNGLPGMPSRKEAKVEDGPWDEASQSGLYFTAVKKDVAVMIDSGPGMSSEQVELRRRLIAKVIEKL